MTRVRARGRSGFTVVEVLVALVLLVAGAMGAVVLQQRGSQAIAYARSMQIALSIAERWAARFKQDTHTWTKVGVFGGSPSASDVLTSTRWLKQIKDDGNLFQTPVMVSTDNISYAFDYYGEDIKGATRANTDLTFCTSFRPQWIYYGRTMRIDIRVWWRKTQKSTAKTIAEDFDACTDKHTDLDPGGAQQLNYHVIYLPVVVNMVTS